MTASATLWACSPRLDGRFKGGQAAFGGMGEGQLGRGLLTGAVPRSEFREWGLTIRLRG